AWQPGQSGNPLGRPLGARSRLSEAFIEAVGEAWAKYGFACLKWLAMNDKATFVHVALALVPKQLKAELEGKKAVYMISDKPLTAEEWEAKYCSPTEGKPN